MSQLPDIVDQMQLLSEQRCCDHDKPKYFQDSITELTHRLSARNYSSITWELAHLLWSLAHTEQNNSLLQFFFIEENVTASTAKTYCVGQKWIHAEYINIQAHHQGLQISIRQHVFLVNWSRINLLSALLELLINLQPTMIEKHAELTGTGLNSIKTIAADLQKILYDWLEDICPPARTQRKYQALAEYFIDDQQHQMDAEFLSAWMSLGHIEGFAKLSNFYTSLCAYMLSASATLKSVTLPEFADNLYSEDDTIYQFISKHETESTLESLPSVPKLMSQKQIAKLSLIMQYPKQLQIIPWSSLLVITFAPIQAKLLQGLRTQATSSENQCFLNDDENYRVQVDFLNAIIELNKQNMLACLGALIEKDSALVLECVTTNIDWLNNLANLKQSPEIALDFNRTIIDLQPKLAESACHALNKNNRKGFTTSTLVDDEIYVSIVDSLQIINKQLQQFKRVFKDKVKVEEKYQSDRHIVFNEFTRRYIHEHNE